MKIDAQQFGKNTSVNKLTSEFVAQKLTAIRMGYIKRIENDLHKIDDLCEDIEKAMRLASTPRHKTKLKKLIEGKDNTETRSVYYPWAAPEELKK